MSVAEFFLRLLSQIEPLAPFLVAAAGATLAALPVLLGLGRNVWVDRRRFRWMGLFLGLGGGDCFRLACCWIKLVLLLSYLIAFRKLGAVHYVLFLAVGALYVLFGRKWTRIPVRLLWLALETLGLLSCNLICGYIRDLGGTALFWAAYVVMALLEGLFGCYLFLTEINDISAGRRENLEKLWNIGDADDGDGE